MKLTFYVDTVSPFAWVAYYVLRNDPVFSKCEITYVPIFLGGVMKATGNTPPINIKNKDVWIDKERLYWAKKFNVPMFQDMPPDFPPLTLNIMRAICALTILHPSNSQQVLCKAFDAFFEAYWVQGRKVIDKGVMTEVLGSIVGSPEELTKVLELAASAPAKELLLKNTDLAVKDGAFGLPWFSCENSKGEREGFWGVDHLGCVVEFMGLEKPRTGGWKALL